MGCGIMFPPDYDSEADSDLSPDENETPEPGDAPYNSDTDSEDEDWAQFPRLNQEPETGTKVQVGL